MTNLGYIKRTSLDMYHSQNRGGKGIKGIETRDGDYVKQLFIASTHDYLMFFTNRGKVYRMKAYEIPEAGRTARGIAIVNLLSLDGEERVSAVIQAKDMEEHGYLLMATRGGQIKKTDLSEYSNIRTNGLIAISLQEGDELIEVKKTDGRNDVFMATRKGQLIRFNEADVRATGRSSMGIRGITLNEEDEVIGMQLGNQGDSALAVTENGMGKRTALSEFSLQHRGGKGNLYYRITKKTGDVVSFKLVNKEQDLMLITDGGIIIRLRVEDISEIGRITSGVKLMGLEGDTKVVSIAKIREEQVEEDTDDPLAGMDFDDVAPEDE